MLQVGYVRTTTGLTVPAELTPAPTPTGVTYTKEQVDALPITALDFRGE
jgi:hypothetical protein